MTRQERPLSLERSANIAILLAAIVCIASWSTRAFTDRPEQSSSPRYAAGDSLADVAEIASADAGQMLVVYVSSRCTYCTESMSLYRQLAATNSDSLVFVAREPVDSLRTYLSTHGIHGANLRTLAPGTAFKTRSTPTILLLNGNKVVERVWIGWQKNQAQQAEIVALLSAPATRPLQ